MERKTNKKKSPQVVQSVASKGMVDEEQRVAASPSHLDRESHGGACERFGRESTCHFQRHRAADGTLMGRGKKTLLRGSKFRKKFIKIRVHFFLFNIFFLHFGLKRKKNRKGCLMKKI